jgi:hypothetical protein
MNSSRNWTRSVRRSMNYSRSSKELKSESRSKSKNWQRRRTPKPTSRKTKVWATLPARPPRTSLHPRAWCSTSPFLTSRTLKIRAELATILSSSRTQAHLRARQWLCHLREIGSLTSHMNTSLLSRLCSKFWKRLRSMETVGKARSQEVQANKSAPPITSTPLPLLTPTVQTKTLGRYITRGPNLTSPPWSTPTNIQETSLLNNNQRFPLESRRPSRFTNSRKLRRSLWRGSKK